MSQPRRDGFIRKLALVFERVADDLDRGRSDNGPLRITDGERTAHGTRCIEEPLSGFCSYSHKDQRYLERLQVHIAQMEREGLINSWCDRRIGVGGEVDPIIQARLEQTDLFLMLLSPDFIASPYCQGVEVKRALERHVRREALVIPIVVKHCDWKNTPFAALKVAPDEGRPICDWRPQDRGWNNAIDRIRFAVDLRRQGVVGL